MIECNVGLYKDLRLNLKYVQLKPIYDCIEDYDWTANKIKLRHWIEAKYNFKKVPIGLNNKYDCMKYYDWTSNMKA